MTEPTEHPNDPRTPDDLCQNPSHKGHRFATGGECMAWLSCTCGPRSDGRWDDPDCPLH
jgi:hypothetical protein